MDNQKMYIDLSDKWDDLAEKIYDILSGQPTNDLANEILDVLLETANKHSFIEFPRKLGETEGNQMTTEEAINRLKYDREMCYFNPSTGVAGEPYDEDCKEMAQALDIAIKALDSKSAGDCISRQAVIDFIKDHSYPVKYDGNSTEQGMTLTGIEQALNEVPSVQPEQKTMRWIDARKECGDFMCSNCQFLCCTNQYNYCPDCGAKKESEAG